MPRCTSRHCGPRSTRVGRRSHQGRRTHRGHPRTRGRRRGGVAGVAGGASTLGAWRIVGQLPPTAEARPIAQWVLLDSTHPALMRLNTPRGVGSAGHARRGDGGRGEAARIVDRNGCQARAGGQLERRHGVRPKATPGAARRPWVARAGHLSRVVVAVVVYDSAQRSSAPPRATSGRNCASNVTSTISITI